MDSITQAALGAAMGELVLGRQLGRRAIVWGAFFGTLPDLDVLLFPFADAASQLELHRGLSHSMLLCLVAPPLIGMALASHWRKFDVSRPRAAWFVFLAWSTHVLIDVFTAYGTQIWEPFSNTRVATSTLFIIDPLFTLPLLIGLGASLWRRRKPGGGANAKSAMRLGVMVAIAYVGWSFAAKAWIDRGLQSDLTKLNNQVIRYTTAPTPFNTLLWRVLVETDSAFLIGFRSVLDDSEYQIQWTRIPHKPPPEEICRPRAYRILRWFTEDWCVIRETSDGIYLTDLRLGELIYPADAGKTAMSPVFAWRLNPPDSDSPFLTLHSNGSNMGDLLGQIARRAMGDPAALPHPTHVAIGTSFKEALPALSDQTGMAPPLQSHNDLNGSSKTPNNPLSP